MRGEVLQTGVRRETGQGPSPRPRRGGCQPPVALATSTPSSEGPISDLDVSHSGSSGITPAQSARPANAPITLPIISAPGVRRDCGRTYEIVKAGR